MDRKTSAAARAAIVLSLLGVAAVSRGGAQERPAIAPPFSGDTVFDTAFREDLSETEKLAGLAKFWMETTYNFANFDINPDVHLDSLYLAFIPRVLATPSTYAYYRVLQQFAHQLHDGHTRVLMPAELADRTRGRVPLQTRLTEGRVVVHAVYDTTLSAAGIRPGVELTAINDVPVFQFAEEEVLPFVTANTPQGLDRMVYEYALLRGPLESTVRLAFRTEDGEVFERTVDRVARAPGPWQPVTFQVLPGNVGHLTIRSFAWDEVLDQIDSLFSRIELTDALVIDLRENGGGDGRIGWTVLSYLTRDPFQIIAWRSRVYRPVWRAWGREQQPLETAAATWAADTRHHYDKPVAVLVRARTASMAENFCVGFRAMGRGLIVGEPTAGSSGTPLMFPLPGGGHGQVVTTRGTYPDGDEYIGVGVIPDIVVQATIADVRRGLDPQLDAAVAHLRSEMAHTSTDDCGCHPTPANEPTQGSGT